MSATEPIPYGYCHCGCGRKTTIAKRTNRTRGAVAGEPRYCLAGHSPLKRGRMKPASWREEDHGYETPCWHWTGSLSPQGYGRWGGKRHQYAHRRMYEQHCGPIAEGMQLDHLCRNRACVNPEHLEQVACEVNVQRGRVAKLTPDDVRAIRASTRPVQVIADAYGVNNTTIYSVRKGESWRNV